MKKFWFMVLLGCLFVGGNSYAKIIDYESFKLDNGLEVVVLTNHRVPLGYSKLYYKAGAFNDPYSKGGIAHLLEHLMFRGTKKLKDREFDRITEKFGARNNAFTSYGVTGYHEFTDISKLELMMALEAERMRGLVIDEDDFVFNNKKIDIGNVVDIVNEKKITEAALFNRAKKDKYFYDGKIVNYGDMGGNNDHDFMEESKNLMKELQSDGFLNKPLNIPDGEGGWEVKDLELAGRPCLTYTTVPNHIFDEQEMSRSIFITPRMDNQKIFNRRKSALFRNGYQV